MSFSRIDESKLNVVELLNDQPNQRGGLSAQQLKQKFDEAVKFVGDYINEVMLAEIEGNGAITGTSGAKNVGVSSRSEFSTYTNVEDVLIYFRELIRQAVAGELSDNDVTTRLLDHTPGSEAVSTEVIRDAAVTNSKIAGPIPFSKISGDVPAERIDGEILNSQLAGEISYEKLAGGIRESQLYGNIPLNKLVSGYIIPTANGGTGSNTLSGARTNLQVTEQGKLKIGNTEYTLRTGTEGAEGYITFVL